MGRQYLRCVSLLSSLAQLSGRENIELVCFALSSGRTGSSCPLRRSRYVALKALEGAAKSEFLYTTGGDYDTQVGEIVPALLSNLADVSVEDLRDECVALELQPCSSS